MKASPPRTIRIAAALIDDDQRNLFLVRKAGTQWFMQAGGKIEEGEDTLEALRRELWEEIGLDVEGRVAQYLGRFSAPAANERDHMVPAAAYHIRVNRVPAIKSEIEEAIWIDPSQAEVMVLAPLTRDHILPLAGNL